MFRLTVPPVMLPVVVIVLLAESWNVPLTVLVPTFIEPLFEMKAAPGFCELDPVGVMVTDPTCVISGELELPTPGPLVDITSELAMTVPEDCVMAPVTFFSVIRLPGPNPALILLESASVPPLKAPPERLILAPRQQLVLTAATSELPSTVRLAPAATLTVPPFRAEILT